MNTIGHEERKVVFGSEMFSRQLVSYCREGRTSAEIYRTFPDVPHEKVRNTLTRQRKLGYLVKEDNKYKATGKTARGNKIDLVWKGARTLRTFTVDELARYTGIDKPYIQDCLRLWKNTGDVVIAVRSSSNTYKMTDKNIMRPVKGARIR